MCYEFDVISHHKYHVQSFTVSHPVSTLSPSVSTHIQTHLTYYPVAGIICKSLDKLRRCGPYKGQLGGGFSLSLVQWSLSTRDKLGVGPFSLETHTSSTTSGVLHLRHVEGYGGHAILDIRTYFVCTYFVIASQLVKINVTSHSQQQFIHTFQKYENSMSTRLFHVPVIRCCERGVVSRLGSFINGASLQRTS